MDQWSASSTSGQRANQVWERMLGCFGESLIRKFGEEPPQEWAAGISMLNDYQLQQGMRRMLYSGKQTPPSLPEFIKLCRTVGHDDAVPDERPALTGPADDGWKGDAWDQAANVHLLGYITRALKDKRTFNADQTRTLVRYKNAWATDMREIAVNGEVAIDVQKASWADFMQGAEAEL